MPCVREQVAQAIRNPGPVFTYAADRREQRALDNLTRPERAAHVVQSSWIKLTRAVPFAIRRKALMLFRSRTAALILIIVGALFLVSNLGWIPRIGPFLHQWWPLILIIVGVLMLVRRS